MARDAVKQVSAKAPHPVTATTETHEASAFVISTADRKLTAFVNGKESFVSPVEIQMPDSRSVLTPLL
jgi:hypothetical protein